MGSATTAQNLDVSPLVIGLAVVGVGTSAPELLVSAMAAIQKREALSVGNAIGSNIVNIALVLGVGAVVHPLRINSKIVRREMPVLVAVMLAVWLMLSDGQLNRIDGGVLFAGMIAVLVWAVRQGLSESNQQSDPLAHELAEHVRPKMSTSRALAWTAAGLVLLLISSRILVYGAVELAEYFGVSELVIGLTVVAFGTSLPELAATMVAARKGEDDIAVGNVIGSNLFNLLGVLGLPGLISPGRLEPGVLSRDFPAMLTLTLLFWGIAIKPWGRHQGELSRAGGAVLLVGFCVYLAVLLRMTLP